MAEYVFKFFLKESEQDGCCSGNDIHEIINWEYTPSEGGTDSVSSVQNTVYNNDPTKYIYIEGNNLLDSENKIKGNLIVRYRCVPQCDLIKRNEATKLRAIQIDGFAAAITAPNNYIFVPIGETIKVQILGGVGPTRFASSENPSIASVSPRISSEDSTYRPEMQILGPEQVDNDCFVVDKPLNDGNHIFSITIKDSGPTKIIFKDEAGCKYYVHLHGAGNLCKHTVNSEQTAFAQITKKEMWTLIGLVKKKVYNKAEAHLATAISHGVILLIGLIIYRAISMGGWVCLRCMILKTLLTEQEL